MQVEIPLRRIGLVHHASSPCVFAVSDCERRGKVAYQKRNMSQQALMSNLYLTNTPHNADLKLLRILSTIRT